MKILIKKRYIDHAFNTKGKVFLIFYTALSLFALYYFTQYWSRNEFITMHNFSFLLSIPIFYSLFKMICSLFYRPCKKKVTKNLR